MYFTITPKTHRPSPEKELCQQKTHSIVEKAVKISSTEDPDKIKIFSLTDTTVKVSEFVDLTFSDLDRDISSCHSVEAMDTPTLNMDSLDFYFEQGDLKLKASNRPSPTEDIDLFDFALSDLDPEAEESVDIHSLIEQSSEVNDHTGGLFPELEAPRPSPLQSTDGEGQAVAVAGSSLTALPVKGRQEDGQMPHQIVKVELPSPCLSGQVSNVLTISAADLASLTSALDGPVVVQYPAPTAKPEEDGTVPEYIEYECPASPGSTISEATSTVSTNYSTPVPTPVRRGPKPKSPAKSTGPVKSRRRALPKESEEYKERRARNNVAVRKSRDKAKLMQAETEQRVQILTSENEKLQKKCDLLTKELSVLKGLFTNVGSALPAELAKYFGSK